MSYFLYVILKILFYYQSSNPNFMFPLKKWVCFLLQDNNNHSSLQEMGSSWGKDSLLYTSCNRLWEGKHKLFYT